jgi:hypothetical protein
LYTLYNSLEVDGAIDFLRHSRFTELIPLLTASGVETGFIQGKSALSAHIVGREEEPEAVVKRLFDRLQELGVEARWAGLGVAAFSSEDPDFLNFMEALDGYSD